MVVQAYILIQTEVGKSTSVAAAISAVEGVLVAEDVTGPYDVIARVEARNVDELGKLVIARVQEVPGHHPHPDVHRRPRLRTPSAAALLPAALGPLVLVAGCSGAVKVDLPAGAAAPACARVAQALPRTLLQQHRRDTRPVLPGPGRLGGPGHRAALRRATSGADHRPVHRGRRGRLGGPADQWRLRLHHLWPDPCDPGPGAEALRARDVRPDRLDRRRLDHPAGRASLQLIGNR